MCNINSVFPVPQYEVLLILRAKLSKKFANFLNISTKFSQDIKLIFSSVFLNYLNIFLKINAIYSKVSSQICTILHLFLHNFF